MSSVEQEAEWIFQSERTLRGTGRTTRAASALHDWAIENPDKRAVYVCMYVRHAYDVKRDFFADTPNVTCIGADNPSVLRGTRLDRLDFDHYAFSESYRRAITRLKDKEYALDQSKDDLNFYKSICERQERVISDLREDLAYAHRTANGWDSNCQDQAREVARLEAILGEVNLWGMRQYRTQEDDLAMRRLPRDYWHSEFSELGIILAKADEEFHA